MVLPSQHAHASMAVVRLRGGGAGTSVGEAPMEVEGPTPTTTHDIRLQLASTLSIRVSFLHACVLPACVYPSCHFPHCCTSNKMCLFDVFCQPYPAELKECKEICTVSIGSHLSWPQVVFVVTCITKTAVQTTGTYLSLYG